MFSWRTSLPLACSKKKIVPFPARLAITMNWLSASSLPSERRAKSTAGYPGAGVPGDVARHHKIGGDGGRILVGVVCCQKALNIKRYRWVNPGQAALRWIDAIECQLILNRCDGGGCRGGGFICLGFLGGGFGGCDLGLSGRFGIGSFFFSLGRDLTLSICRCRLVDRIADRLGGGFYIAPTGTAAREGGSEEKDQNGNDG